MRAAWVCDVCGQQIECGSGRFELVNANPDMGHVGGYPRESQDQWEQLKPSEQMALLGLNRDPDALPDTYSAREMIELLSASMERPRNIQIRIHHVACDPDPDGSGYHIPLGELETFEGLMHWVEHLHEKTWFGREELYNMLRAWQTATRTAERTQ